jgi:hypothetical protein
MRSKSTYTRVMAKTLGGEAEHEAEKLAGAPGGKAHGRSQGTGGRDRRSLDGGTGAVKSILRIALVIDEILVGRGSLLTRLRGPGASARGVCWESVVEVGERIVVRA